MRWFTIFLSQTKNYLLYLRDEASVVFSKENFLGILFWKGTLVKFFRHNNQSNVHKSGMGLMLSLYMEAKEDQEKGKGI